MQANEESRDKDYRTLYYRQKQALREYHSDFQPSINLESANLYAVLGMLYPGNTDNEDMMRNKYLAIKEGLVRSLLHAIEFPEVAKKISKDINRLDFAYNILNGTRKGDYDIFHVCKFGDPDGEEYADMISLYEPRRVKLRNKKGNTPFLVACKHNTFGAAQGLFDCDATLINDIGEKGNNALMLACAFSTKNKELIEWLLEKNSLLITAKNLKGETPLMLAVKTQHIEAVKLLLAHHAYPVDKEEIECLMALIAPVDLTHNARVNQEIYALLKAEEMRKRKASEVLSIEAVTTPPPSTSVIDRTQSLDAHLEQPSLPGNRYRLFDDVTTGSNEDDHAVKRQKLEHEFTTEELPTPQSK